MSSSLIVVIACMITAFQKGVPPHVEGEPYNPDYGVFIQLSLLGVGYSIYASALWGSIPYVVEPKILGTAFCMCTAVQNTGLVIAPYVIGKVQNG